MTNGVLNAVILAVFRVIALALDGAILIQKVVLRVARQKKRQVLRSRNEPESINDFVNKNLLSLLTKEEFKLDRERKQRMGVDELAWEQKLEENLGNFYLLLYKRSKIKGEKTLWDFVALDKTLPTVLVIGDSISQGYTVTLRRALMGIANVLRAPENCGSSRNGSRKMDIYTQGRGKIDVIVFNFGIHDRNSSPSEYKTSLSEVTRKIMAKCSSAIFVSTTPFFPSIRESMATGHVFATFRNWYLHGRGMDEVQLNSIARSVSDSFGVHFIDIAGEMREDLICNRKPNDVHFHEPYYAVIAELIAEEVGKVLTKGRTPGST